MQADTSEEAMNLLGPEINDVRLRQNQLQGQFAFEINKVVQVQQSLETLTANLQKRQGEEAEHLRQRVQKLEAQQMVPQIMARNTETGSLPFDNLELQQVQGQIAQLLEANKAERLCNQRHLQELNMKVQSLQSVVDCQRRTSSPTVTAPDQGLTNDLLTLSRRVTGAESQLQKLSQAQSQCNLTVFALEENKGERNKHFWN